MDKKTFIENLNNSIEIINFHEFGDRGLVDRDKLANLWATIYKDARDGFENVGIITQRITPKFLRNNCIAYRLFQGRRYFIGLYIPEKFIENGLCIEFTDDFFSDIKCDNNFFINNFMYEEPKYWWSPRAKFCVNRCTIKYETIKDLVDRFIKNI